MKNSSYGVSQNLTLRSLESSVIELFLGQILIDVPLSLFKMPISNIFEIIFR
ncbi:hypothetical protein [Leptospira santarosai]|uniref:hypothetical protein n=1 Tax=Leptospira santarosai TaxID=28183 RepID=UPI0012BA8239|nr:hypothetical protein [Leptospira santarosai]